MAAYCTPVEVQAIMPGEDNDLDDATTWPTLATLTIECDKVANQINASLIQGGVSIPVVDVDLLGKFNLLSKREVAYQMMATKGVSTGKELNPLWVTWHKDFMDTLDKLEDPNTAATLSSTGTCSSFTMDAPSSTDTSINAQLTKNREW